MILEKFKLFSVSGEVLDGALNDWLEEHPNVVLCALDYHATVQDSRLMVTYVENEIAAKNKVGDLQFKEFYCVDCECAPITEQLNAWREANPNRIISSVSTCMGYDEKYATEYVLLAHAKRPTINE